MIPDIEDLRGSLVEIHADEGADLSKAMLDYIKDMQDEHEKILTCYYDVRGNLRREDAEQSVFDKIWMVPTLEGRAAQESLMFAMKNTDIVVIDDIPYVDGDLRRFVGSLEIGTVIDDAMRAIEALKSSPAKARPACSC